MLSERGPPLLARSRVRASEVESPGARAPPGAACQCCSCWRQDTID